MGYNLSPFKKILEEKRTWLTHELTGVRTGRATPALLDSVSVEVYGSRMRINEVASVGVENPRTLYISPWDKSQIKPIEKAITVADLGVSVGSDEQGVRVSFPELTSERRTQLMKLVRAKMEDARVAVKNERAKVIGDIENNEPSENEIQRLKLEVQKIVDDTNAALEEIVKKKEQELAN